MMMANKMQQNAAHPNAGSLVDQAIRRNDLVLCLRVEIICVSPAALKFPHSSPNKDPADQSILATRFAIDDIHIIVHPQKYRPYRR